MVGVLWLSWTALKLLKFFAVEFHAFVLAPWGMFRTNLNKYGEWAGEPILKYISVVLSATGEKME